MRRTDGICPRCGEKPRIACGYCLDCHNAYKRERWAQGKGRGFAGKTKKETAHKKNIVATIKRNLKKLKSLGIYSDAIPCYLADKIFDDTATKLEIQLWQNKYKFGRGNRTDG